MSTLSPAAVAVITEMERLLTEKGWTQGKLARGKTGELVSTQSQDATCFCLMGAALAATGGRLTRPLLAVEAALNAAVEPKYYSYVTWQDHPGRTREEALALLARVKGGGA